MSSTDRPARSTYRYSPVAGMRLAGIAAVAFGVSWVVAGFAGFATWSVWLVAVVGVVLVAVVLRFCVLPPRLLTLTDEGYVVHHVRGNQTRSAQWSEVEGAATTHVAGAPAVRIELSGERTSLVPLSVLGGQSVRAQRDIHDRLNDAFGYRPLDTSR